MAQRQPRERCKAFLAYVRTLPCSVPWCRREPTQAAHIRMGSIKYDKRYTGKAEKPSDRWAVPLCQSCHLDAPDAQHKGHEVTFWNRVGIDPFELANSLWAKFWNGRPVVFDQPPARKGPRPVNNKRPTSKPRNVYNWPKGRKLKGRNTWPEGRRF